MVKNAQISPDRIVFEITETMVMQDYDRALPSLNYIRDEGFHIALDDFGTGFSSLSYVQQLPIDRLKIDRSFIKEIANSSQTYNIVRTISDLCRNLKITCIVEGVENERQLKLVNDLGLQYIQGYYFSKPLSPSTALVFAQFKKDGSTIETDNQWVASNI